jgi:hypothetical protein
MKRTNVSRKVIDLGRATRETKGGSIGTPDHLGQQVAFGLTND